jgi:hypothetical protein
LDYSIRVLIGLQRNPSRNQTSFSSRVAFLRYPGDLSLTVCPYLPKDLKNKSIMTHIPQPPSLESKSRRFGIKDPKDRGMQYMTVRI